MYGTPIARKMEQFWYQHGGKWDHPEWRSLIEDYIEMVDTKKEEWLTEHTNLDAEGNDVYGFAKAAGCVRDSTLGLLDVDREDFSGSTEFTFWLGHTVECMALATLQQIGYPVVTTQSRVEVPGLMASASDGEITYLGKPTIVSVKSAAYKMSGKTRGKFVRRGFPELPLEGIFNSQPSWYVQGNLEAYASGYNQWMCVVAAKDIVKAFEGDDIMGEKGNGSLTFYTELFQVNEKHAKQTIAIHEESMEAKQHGNAGEPWYWIPKNGGEYVRLHKAEFDPNNIWGGKNQVLTGKFNPCGGCARVEACKEYA